MDPPPCNSGISRLVVIAVTKVRIVKILGIYQDPNIMTIILYRHFYRVGGPPKGSILDHL